MWVVKLGGSLGRDPLLPRWLDMLGELGGGRVIVVPGGGVFADQAREAQACWPIDDVAAHNIAVLGMAQMAALMKGLCPVLELACSEGALPAVLQRGRVALWQPLDLLREHADDLTNWQVTSDSLALRLAGRLAAQRLVIVKSCAIEADASLARLSAAGVLDAAFATRARTAGVPIEVLSRHALEPLRQALAAGMP